MPALEGRCAFIAGSGGPWIRAISLALAEAGMGIALVTASSDDARAFEMNSIANELWALGRPHLTLSFSYAEPASAAEAVQRAAAELGLLSLAVNGPEPIVNSSAAPFLETAHGVWQRDLLRCIDAVAITGRATGAAMLAGGNGGILNLVSSQAKGQEELSALAAAHAGIIALSRSLALEWNGRVAVNVAILRADSEPAALASLATLLAVSSSTAATVSGQVFEL